MLGSEVLDVAIGLALVFLLLSLTCSAIREGLETWFKTRAVYLEKGIFQLLGKDRGVVQTVYNHPLVANLFQGDYDAAAVAGRTAIQRTTLPSYIPAASFAQTILDLAARGQQSQPGATVHRVDVAGGGPARITAENIRSTVHYLGQPDVQRVVLSALDRAKDDVDAAQVLIEQWYNSTMDRVSGWYKRRTQAYLLLFGALFSVLLNADAIKIARHLYRDQSARAALVGMADAAVHDASIRGAVSASRAGQAGSDSMAGASGDSAQGTPSSNTSGAITQQELLKRVDALGLPLGWGRYAPQGARDLPMAFLGWFMTALAVSLGAPFWFDLLNKFMVVRSTVKPHEKSPEEGSEDRQTPSERRASVVVTPVIPGGAPPGGVAAPVGAASGGAPAPASTTGSRPAGLPPTDKELQAALPTRPAIRVNP